MGLGRPRKGPEERWEPGAWALETDETALFPRLTLDGFLPPLSLRFIFCKRGHLMETCGRHRRWSLSVPRVVSTRPFVVTRNCEGKRGAGGHRVAEWGTDDV